MPLGRIYEVRKSSRKPKNQVATKAYVQKALSTAETRAQVIQASTSPQSLSYDSPLVSDLFQYAPANKRVEVKEGLQFRAFLRGGASVSSEARILIFQWLSSNATAPDLDDILQAYVASVDTGYEAINCPPNFTNRSNYKMLYDRAFSVPAFDTTSTVKDSEVRIDIMIPLKRLQRKYLISADDAESGYKGHVYMIGVSNTADVGTNPTIEFMSSTVMHQIATE